MSSNSLDSFLQGMKQAVRTEFAFLHKDFGFPPEPEEGPASLQWRGPTTHVTCHIEREGSEIELNPSSQDPAFSRPLGLLVILADRRPDLLDEMSRAAATDQWLAEKTRILARGLREAGADLLRGDFSAAPSLLEQQDHLRQEYDRQARAHEEQRLAERARKAFHSGRFDEVVELLSPAADRIGPALTKLLATARGRQSPGG